MRKSLLLAAFLFFVAHSALYAQDIQTKGSLAGTIVDVNAALIQNATVTVTGQKTIDRIVTTNDVGVFEIPNLTPGLYRVKVEKTGFKTVFVSHLEVFVGKVTALKLTLEIGNISEVVDVSSSSAAVDQSSTAVGANLSDQLFQSIPLQRGVASVIYLAPGTTDSLGGGVANPSISGGSPLDNLYIADGVSITDAGFGGLGVFSRLYGTLGTGINTSFIKEVQVKTAGFEPQYGQSQGGIVNIVTQSGGTEYFGAAYAFARPASLEATRLQPDDFSVNKFGKILHQESYDVGLNVGGYVPHLRNNLLFFGSFNPTVRREIVRGAQRNSNDIANGTGIDSGLFKLLGDTTRRYRTLNYAFKLDYLFNKNHTVAFSIFGDPTSTNLAPIRTLNIDNTTALSRLDFGTRNMALRYNGAITQTWTVSAAFSQGRSHLVESGFADFNVITDRTQPARGNFRAIGLGSAEPNKSETHRLTIDTSKQFSFLGMHTFGLGYQYQRARLSGRLQNSGPRFPIPATNASGVPLTAIAGPAAAIAVGQLMSPRFNLFTAPASCTLCPFLNIPGVGDRRVFLQGGSEFGEPVFDVRSNYHAAYIQDTWRFNRHLTALLGLRTEQERLIGTPASVTGKPISYSLTGQWAPRLGVTVDPLGRGKTKLSYNFGRFFEFIPLDLAERALSDFSGFGPAAFAPDLFIDATGKLRARLNQFGVVVPVIDSAHFLNKAAGGVGTVPLVSLQDPTNSILPGTKLGFAQEHVIEFEQQLPRNFVLSVRYIDRRLKRIVEDGAVTSPESSDFFSQTYFIGNINSKLDAGVNPISHVLPTTFVPIFDENDLPTNLPHGCNPNLFTEVHDSQGNLLGSVCYESNGANGRPAGSFGADGVADGFPDPVHIYRAVEIELNKRFSANWQLLSNWRIASLKGNFEGHFRNDNNQTDPAVSTLFDFTEGDFGLLGDQNGVGPLNTDRRHVVNIYGSYGFSEKGFRGFGGSLKGLNLGAGMHMESGVPISEFLAHPVYINSPGEIPVGGRGKLGRTAFFTQLDLHADYPWAITERLKLNFIVDLFNVTNSREVRLPNQFRESTAGQLNPDFLQPQSFHLPFNMRVGLRLHW